MKVPRLKTRILWGFNPITRKVPSKKVYNRLRAKLELKMQEQ